MVCKGAMFSFAKLSGMDIRLSPEMKSNKEAIGYDDDMMRAFTRLCGSGHENAELRNGICID